jgi:thiaminase
MATQQLLQGLESQWKEATVGHKFIRACVDGSVKPEQFNTWLAQVRACYRAYPWVHCCLCATSSPGIQPLH